MPRYRRHDTSLLSNADCILQKVNLSSTLRRLGEDLYKSRLVRFAEDETGTVAPPPIPPHQQGSDKRIDKEGVFFRSPNLHIRLLSSLIILTSPLQGKFSEEIIGECIVGIFFGKGESMSLDFRRGLTGYVDIQGLMTLLVLITKDNVYLVFILAAPFGLFRLRQVQAMSDWIRRKFGVWGRKFGSERNISRTDLHV